MWRVIGMDIHRTFAEVVVWQDGRLRWSRARFGSWPPLRLARSRWEHGSVVVLGRVDMTRAGLEGFSRSLTKTDEVVIEAPGNAMAVVRVLRPTGGG